MKIRTLKNMFNLFIILQLIILIYIINISYIYTHEIIHQEIYNKYDIKSKVNVNYFALSGSTSVPESEYNKKCNSNCKLAHNINEIVGYQLQMIYFLLSLFFGWYLFFKFRI